MNEKSRILRNATTKRYRHRHGISKKYYGQPKPFEPWKKTYKNILTRCYFDKNSSYFKRKIQCLISYAELKTLWIRDKASLMKYPSIDRIDGKKDYTYENCRYMELTENKKQKKTKREGKNNVNA